MSMFAFLAGGFSPFLLGYVKPVLGLSNGLSALNIAYVLAGLCVYCSKVFPH